MNVTWDVPPGPPGQLRVVPGVNVHVMPMIVEAPMIVDPHPSLSLRLRYCVARPWFARVWVPGTRCTWRRLW